MPATLATYPLSRIDDSDVLPKLLPLSRLRSAAPYRIELSLVMADSLRRDGQITPITCTASGIIRDGHRRFAAARWLGMTLLKVVIVP